MNLFTKRYWLMLAAMGLITFASTNRLSAQIVINSPDDIVQPSDGLGEAYYDAATGDVYFALGAPGSFFTDLLLVGIANVDDQLIFANFDNTTDLSTVSLGGPADPATITEIVFLNNPTVFGLDTLPGGIFNLGSLLPADPSITDIASFQASPFGDAQLQFSTGPIEGFRDFNLIAATAVPEPGSLSLFTLAGLAAFTRRRRS